MPPHLQLAYRSLIGTSDGYYKSRARSIRFSYNNNVSANLTQWAALGAFIARYAAVVK
jgi:hypothetical protein